VNEKDILLSQLLILRKRAAEIERELGLTWDLDNIPNLTDPITLASFHLFQEFGSEMLTIHNMDGQIIYVSQNSIRLFGWRSEELIGRNAKDMMHPTAPFSASQDGLVYKFQCGDGTYRWVSAQVKPIKLPSGTTQAISLTKDVDDIVSLEQRIILLTH